ncbi:peptide methionine sulfoxide reductase msrA/msrB [Desulfovibrio legallii]|uniref:Peptide methionine sulfoxide reductase MsrA n=1 Tax=Desulfovibrio legallii TaxID=571438 RepID=A0A1G7PBR9_9BACT|nr:bifunctional methionine sulfoxide reductase B/A protein [Desulfovibrio legallii]SDF83039.1 peptide methionine sulfoxide reductase msrA/msrB [Desulfovibrio legallii]
MKTLPPLSPEETAVLLHKATEPPFSGAYVHTAAPGRYCCRQCGTPLFRAEDKFDSGSGWPSFDDTLPGAVRRQPDADGHRAEIVCARCGGHLGHVFAGEGFTPKNTRHCVNSLSLHFVPAGEEAPAVAAAPHGAAEAGLQNADPACTGVAVVAGGCFWGVEDALGRLPGVCTAQSGYTGGHTAEPSYEEVCSGETGHAEAVRLTFNPAAISYEQILRRFFEIHDPTQRNRQGPDVGEQYRSAVFWLDADQKAVALRLLDELRGLGYAVTTQVLPAGPFYPAEPYHQHFARRTGRGVCHMSVPRFSRRAKG